jgi:hypothetical protein
VEHTEKKSKVATSGGNKGGGKFKEKGENVQMEIRKGSI